VGNTFDDFVSITEAVISIVNTQNLVLRSGQH